MSANDLDIAIFGAVMKTIPNSSLDLSVTTTAAADDISEVAGKWVVLEAIGGDVTYKKGDHASTLTAGSSLVLTNGDTVDFFISGDGELELTHVVASGTATLRIHYDSEIG
jgi:hypothetical protein